MSSSPGDRVGLVTLVVAVCALVFVFTVCKLYGV